jgi:hypothetical protein
VRARWRGGSAAGSDSSSSLARSGKGDDPIGGARLLVAERERRGQGRPASRARPCGRKRKGERGGKRVGSSGPRWRKRKGKRDMG